MLPLTTLDEKSELVLSSDPDVLFKRKADRVPTHALLKSKAKINGGAPLVVCVRPLNSREALRIMSMASQSEAETVIRAAEMAVVSIKGTGLTATTTEQINVALDRLPVAALSALGSYVIQESINGGDPT